MTKAAASHFVIDCGGTAVKVGKEVGLIANKDKVGVIVYSGTASPACVDITLKVSAAAVYSEFKVAAGWGVATVKGPQASIIPKARIEISK